MKESKEIKEGLTERQIVIRTVKNLGGIFVFLGIVLFVVLFVCILVQPKDGVMTIVGISFICMFLCSGICQLYILTLKK